ncbi:MAG: hypothetical protein ABSG53_28060 [Thermoguttaceae bacterium]
MRIRTVAVIIVVLLLLPTFVWAWMHYAKASRVQKVKDLQAQVREGGKQMTDEERRQRFEEIRKAAENLSQSEREELARQRMAAAARREQEQFDKYMAMNAQQRRAYCLKMAEEEARRARQREAQLAQAGGWPGSSPGGGESASSSGRGGSGDGQGGRGGARIASPERRLQFQKMRLDNTTPEQRTERTIMQTEMARVVGQQNVIRSQQGLPPLPIPGQRRF